MNDASYTQVTGKLDLINRQDALEAIRNIKAITGTFDDEILLIDKAQAQTELMMLPSAQPERKKGKWIDYSEDGFVECSFCHSATNCEGNKDELHYCFCCGADMRGEQDE